MPYTVSEGAKVKGSLDRRAALEVARQRYADRNPLSLAAHRRATVSLPGGNTRSVLHTDPFPLFFKNGKGSILTDLDGHRYDDFLGEYTAGIYGHSHPKILATLRGALGRGLSLGGHNRHEAELGELLIQRYPALEQVRFTNSGTEANLMALGAARVVTGRDRIMVFSGGYHGGVLAFTHASRVNAPFDTTIAPYNNIEATRSLIRDNGPALAAVIVEPMLQSGGCIPAASAFLEMLRLETSAVGALLIFDEVVTSRLHPGGVHGALGLRPDLVTLGKYIGGGLSFGAFGGDQRIMTRFDPRTPGYIPHAGTFNNNTLTMSVAFVGLSEIYTPDAALALNARGETLRADLNRLASERQAALQFTGLGSIMAAHMTSRPISSPEDAAAGSLELRDLLFFHLLDRGIYVAKRGMISLSLAIADSQVGHLKAGVSSFLDTYGPLLAMESDR